MNMNMALAVHPTDGRVTVVGTEATNEIRFEPNLNGTFVRVHLALVDLAGPTSTIVDLNDHLTYASSTVAQPDRGAHDASIRVADGRPQPGDLLLVTSLFQKRGEVARGAASRFGLRAGQATPRDEQ